MHKFIPSLFVGFLWLFVILPKAQATHMVGGEINYRCLGNDQYEIKVTVFRDCDTGVPWFDNPASVGVFDRNDSLIYDLRLTLRNNDTLDLDLTDPCLVVPPNVCIHTTTYIDTIALPFRVGGYQIVYQRCCRNQDIVNIVDPTATGATYTAFISEAALLTCNSSAQFNEWPPVYICAGVPIRYDHSATDIDGDSIVYELCTPFTGASPQQSQPQPPNNPPYNPVTWLPPYSMDNMLGGPDSLKIHPTTGLLTGTPNIIGVFVVGICVKEYRNGQLIATTRRDFQYVVGICGQLVSSSFFAPHIQCDNSLAVSFQNNSASLGTGFVWFFGDSLQPNPSTYANPSHIYPDTGSYTVMLIADPGTLCADTSYQTINLQYESIAVDFDVQTASCTDSFLLDVTDLTVDSMSTIVQWNWDFGNGLKDTIPYSSTVYNYSGQYIIQLDVLAANGCSAHYQDTLVLDLPTITDNDTVSICRADSAVILNAGGNPNHFYQWEPALGLSNPNSPSPMAFRIGNQARTYRVTVTAPNGVDTCRLERSITVLPYTLNTLQTSGGGRTCADSVTLNAYSPQAIAIEWSTDPNFSSIEFRGDSIRIPVYGTRTLFVRAINQYGCFVVDTIDVIKQNLPSSPQLSYQGAGCSPSFAVQFWDDTPALPLDSIVAWTWFFGDGTQSSQQHPRHNYAQTGVYEVRLQIQTATGCQGEVKDSIFWQVPQLNIGDTVGVCPNQTSVILNQGGASSLQYQWSPSTSLNNDSIASPLATPPTLPYTYTVIITAINDNDTCQEVTEVQIVAAPPLVVTAPPVVYYCGDSVTLEANSPDAVAFEWSGDASFNTIIATGNPIRVQPLTRPMAGYYVRGRNKYGCSATAFVLVQESAVAVPNFMYQSLGCSDSIHIQFTDLSVPMGNPIIAWNWATSDGQFSTAQHPVFSFAQSQTVIVTLTLTFANGCTAFKHESISFNLASYTQDTIVALCDGATSTTLNAGGNPSLRYQWSPAGSLSSPSATAPVATPPVLPYTYTVTVTAFNALDTCVDIHQVTLVDAPPITIQVPKDTITCASTYAVQSTITNATGVEWSFNSNFSPIAVRNTTSFFVNIPTPPSTLVMYVRAMNQYGCMAIDTLRVLHPLANLPVSFTTQINSCNTALDATFTNTSTLPSGFQLQHYTWDLGNGQTSTSQHATATYTQSHPIVRLTLTATNGCTGEFIDTLEYDLPQLHGADSLYTCGTDSVQLNAGADSGLIYQWSPVTGLDNPTSPSPIAAPNSNTNYTVTITALNGGDTCQAIHQVWVNVEEGHVQKMNDTLLCDNSISLYADAPTGTLIEWALNRDFSTILGAGNPFQTYVNDARWFYLRGSSPTGCTAFDSVWVDYQGAAIPVAIDYNPIFCGDSIRIQWLGIGLDSSQQWQWDLGNGRLDNTQNPIGNYYNDSIYTITLEVQGAGGCKGVDSQKLHLLIPNLTLPSAVVHTCSNDSIQLLSATPSQHQYFWSPSWGISNPSSPNPMVLPPTSTTYHIRTYGLIEGMGYTDTCWIEDSVQVLLEPVPSLSVGEDSVYCDSVPIVLRGYSNTAQQYNWATTTTFFNIISENAQCTTSITRGKHVYYLRVQNALNCSVVDSVVVEYYPVSVTLENTTLPCSNTKTLLTATHLTSGRLNYEWWEDDRYLLGVDTNQLFVSVTDSTLYTLYANNIYGCRDSAMIWVAGTSDSLAVQMFADKDTINVGEQVQLWATQQQGGQYHWATEDGDMNVGGGNCIVQPIKTSTYYVTVTDINGCVAVDSITIYVKNAFCAPSRIYIPNAFSPNGDGHNDVISIHGNNITHINFVVYNRWGKQVYRTTEQQNAWDGTYKGSRCPPDVYGYYLICRCLDGQELVKKGNITLLR